MSDDIPKGSLLKNDTGSESITTNSGLVVNAEWTIEMTDTELNNPNIDNFRIITGKATSSRPEKQILINHKRVK